MSQVIVIGAGITGITTAYELLQDGHSVTVVEQCAYPAMETSFANGGQLSASNTEVWNSWGTIAKGLRWMLRSDAPLLINPRPSFHKLSWFAEFCSSVRHHRRNTLEGTRLALAARERLFEIAKNENIAFDLERRGILHVYHDRAAFDSALRGNALLQEAGLERYTVTPHEMRDIEPALPDGFYGGLYTPSDATGDIHKFVRGLAQVCWQRGARFRPMTRVSALPTVRGKPQVRLADARTGLPQDVLDADAVVVCAGVHSRSLAKMVGDRVNIYPVKGYSITVNLSSEESQSGAPTVSLLDDAAKIVTSRLGRDRFRVAGTAEFNGLNRDIRAARVAPLLNWVRYLFPRVDTSQSVPWTGLRPMMPDMMPHVGRGKRAGIYYNTGHGHLGWTYSAATAVTIASILREDGQNPV